MLLDFLTFMDAHGSGLAAIAAIIGIPFLIWQIAQAAWHESRRRKARRLAALSTLPMTLSAISLWARNAATTQLHVYRWAKGNAGADPFPGYQPPESPAHIIEGIERMIEAAPRSRVALTLTAIVAKIQVLEARLSATEEFSVGRVRGQSYSIDDNLLLAASVYGLAGSLFDEARKLSEGVPDDFEELKSALLIMQVYEGQYPVPHELLVRRAAKQRLQRRRGYEQLADWVKLRWAPNGAPQVPAPPE